MFWYLVVFTGLAALALIERGQKWPGIAAAVILGLMCGLRYETGFDWVEYELHYQLAPALFQTDYYSGVTPIEFEPGFELLNQILRSAGADFQWLLFVIGAFNMAVLYAFTRRFSPLVVVALLWYYGFCFLTGQMATMRYALAVSFFYLAFMRRNDGKVLQAAALALAGALIHVVALIAIVPLFGPGLSKVKRAAPVSALIAVAITGLFASIAAGNLFVRVADILLSLIHVDVVTSRLEIYSSLAGAQISPTTLALVAMHIAFVAIVQRKGADDYIARAAVWSAWMSVILHSWFAPFPALWNRATLITFPLEAIVICRVYAPALEMMINRLRLVGVAAIGALMALIYALSGEQSLVYTPYQNLAVVWVRGPYGTGRLRYQVVRNVNNAMLAAQKAR